MVTYVTWDVLFVYVHSMNHTYAYLRDERKIKFRLDSVQQFINEAHDMIHSYLSFYITITITIVLNCRPNIVSRTFLFY